MLVAVHFKSVTAGSLECAVRETESQAAELGAGWVLW